MTINTLPNAGTYSDEWATNSRTWKLDKRKVRVSCPKCHSYSSPLCSPKTTILSSEWKWVTCEYREPHTTFRSVCRQCGIEYQFTLRTPQ